MSAMTTITRFDKTNLDTLRKEIDDALAPIAARHGIQLHAGRITYAADNARITLEAAVVTPDGMVLSREATAFRELAHLYGLQPSDLGRTFTLSGTEYTIVGLRTRATRAPILARTSDGKLVGFPAEPLVEKLKRVTAG